MELDSNDLKFNAAKHIKNVLKFLNKKKHKEHYKRILDDFTNYYYYGDYGDDLYDFSYKNLDCRVYRNNFGNWIGDISVFNIWKELDKIGFYENQMILVDKIVKPHCYFLLKTFRLIAFTPYSDEDFCLSYFIKPYEDKNPSNYKDYNYMIEKTKIIADEISSLINKLFHIYLNKL